jgi:hypothetical protein
MKYYITLDNNEITSIGSTTGDLNKINDKVVSLNRIEYELLLASKCDIEWGISIFEILKVKINNAISRL